MNINIKKLNENAIIPTRGSEYAAGYDLYACIDNETTISSHETVKISTGLAVEIPHGYFGGLFARSGLSTKKGIGLATSVSVIDEDYRGELIIPLHNYSNDTVVIPKNERVAQLVVLPYLTVEFTEVDELTDTKRNCGGFGSTSVN